MYDTGYYTPPLFPRYGEFYLSSCGIVGKKVCHGGIGHIFLHQYGEFSGRYSYRDAQVPDTGDMSNNHPCHGQKIPFENGKKLKEKKSTAEHSDAQQNLFSFPVYTFQLNQSFLFENQKNPKIPFIRDIQFTVRSGKESS